MLTTFDLDEYVYGALRAGASGFLLKDGPADATRIKQSAPSPRRRTAGTDDHAPVDRRVRTPPARPTTCRRPRWRSSPSANARSSRLLARGLSNAEIAAELILSEATIKTHVAHLLAKLSLRDRTQAVIFAYESGLARPGTQQL